MASSESSSSLKLLCINAGSSSLKITIYHAHAHPTNTTISSPSSHSYSLQHIKSKNIKFKKNEEFTYNALLEDEDIDLHNIDVVVHRIVQGGYFLRDPVVINADVMKKLNDASALDPLHNPPSI